MEQQQQQEQIQWAVEFTIEDDHKLKNSKSSPKNLPTQ